MKTEDDIDLIESDVVLELPNVNPDKDIHLVHRFCQKMCGCSQSTKEEKLITCHD